MFKKGDDCKFQVWSVFMTHITRWFWRQICEVYYVWESGMSVYVLYVHLPTCVFAFDVGMDELLNRPSRHRPKD